MSLNNIFEITIQLIHIVIYLYNGNWIISVIKIIIILLLLLIPIPNTIQIIHVFVYLFFFTHSSVQKASYLVVGLLDNFFFFR